MPYHKGSAYLTNNLRKKLADDKKREYAAEAEAQALKEQAQEQKDADAANSKRDPPIVINTKTGRGGGHNWYVPATEDRIRTNLDGSPRKNAGTTHPLTARCFLKGHAGVCRLCKNIASGIDGCSDCPQTPKDLQYTNIRFTAG